MYNITIIFTTHSEYGKCNSDELYKIIESICPEVIFEELSYDLFDRVYNENSICDEILEIKCIKRYLRNYSIKHIPVDIDVSSNLPASDIDYMLATFKKYDVYRKLETEQVFLTTQYGFAYLNSDECSEFFDKKKLTEKKLIEFGTYKDILLRIYKLFYEEQDIRESEMLRNIYNYSKKNLYDQAVFLIGAAHRNSIIKKITELDRTEKLNLSWKFY